MRRSARGSLAAAALAVLLLVGALATSAQAQTAPNVAPTPPAGGLTQVIAGTTDIQSLIDAQPFVVESVWRFDIATQRFQVYIPGAPTFVNTLTALATTDIVTLKAGPAASTLIMSGRVLLDGAPVVGAELWGGYLISSNGGGGITVLAEVITGANGEYSFELPWATVEEFVLPQGPIWLHYIGADALPCYYTGGAGAPVWLLVESPGAYTLDMDVIVCPPVTAAPHD